MMLIVTPRARGVKILEILISIKVFRYSFSETIPIFFNRLKIDFALVR